MGAPEPTDDRDAGYRRGSLPGALILAVVATGAATPAATIFMQRGLSLGEGMLALFLLFLMPCYGATVWLERDARRTLRLIEARRLRARKVERWLDGADLPFTCEEGEFSGIVQAELAALPQWIHDELERLRVPVLVADRRDGEPHVLGIYERRPVAGRSWGGSTVDVEAAITLYRLPLVRHARAAAALPDAVRETLLHEIGHAFGMSEDDLDRFTIGNDPRPDAWPVRPRGGA